MTGSNKHSIGGNYERWAYIHPVLKQKPRRLAEFQTLTHKLPEQFFLNKVHFSNIYPTLKKACLELNRFIRKNYQLYTEEALALRYLHNVVVGIHLFTEENISFPLSSLHFLKLEKKLDFLMSATDRILDKNLRKETKEKVTALQKTYAQLRQFNDNVMCSFYVNSSLNTTESPRNYWLRPPWQEYNEVFTYEDEAKTKEERENFVLDGDREAALSDKLPLQKDMKITEQNPDSTSCRQALRKSHAPQPLHDASNTAIPA